VHRFVYLKMGLALVLVFVGAKMMLADVYKMPVLVSLAVIATLIGGSIAASLLAARNDDDDAGSGGGGRSDGGVGGGGSPVPAEAAEVPVVAGAGVARGERAASVRAAGEQAAARLKATLPGLPKRPVVRLKGY
jgi:hypothetical protein